MHTYIYYNIHSLKCGQATLLMYLFLWHELKQQQRKMFGKFAIQNLLCQSSIVICAVFILFQIYLLVEFLLHFPMVKNQKNYSYSIHLQPYLAWYFHRNDETQLRSNFCFLSFSSPPFCCCGTFYWLRSDTKREDVILLTGQD